MMMPAVPAACAAVAAAPDADGSGSLALGEVVNLDATQVKVHSALRGCHWGVHSLHGPAWTALKPALRSPVQLACETQ